MTDKAWIAGGVRLIKMMVELNRRGFQLLRIFPYEYPIAWRLQIAPKSCFSIRNGAYIGSAGDDLTSVEDATYSSASELKYFGWSKVEALDAEQLAGVFTGRFPRLCEAASGRDWEYAGWLSELSGHVSRTKQLPFVMSEYFEPAPDELTYLPLRDYSTGGEISMAWTRRAVGEGVKFCPRAGCGRSGFLFPPLSCRVIKPLSKKGTNFAAKSMS